MPERLKGTCLDWLTLEVKLMEWRVSTIRPTSDQLPHQNQKVKLQSTKQRGSLPSDSDSDPNKSDFKLKAGILSILWL